MTTCKELTKKGSLEEFWNGAHLEGEEMEDIEIHGAGGYNRNEREGNWRLGMGRQRGVEKKSKLTYK